MKNINKRIVALFVGLLFVAGSVVAQPGHHPQGPAPDTEVMESGMPAVCPHAAMQPQDIQANNACYLSGARAFVLIDSIDCSVDVIMRRGDSAVRVGRYTTDVFMGRHDLKNILRPASISVMGDKLIVLASSKKDSSYIAVVDLSSVLAPDAESNDSLQHESILGFRCASYAFLLNPMDDEILVVGKNPVGYDVNIVSIADGLEHLAVSGKFHYHVPKQSERIQASDPVGVGLTVVAIAVVFFALICICFIMKWYGAAIMKVQDRRTNKALAQGSGDNIVKSKDVSGEVYAAIAAAIYAYDQDLHDEEDTVITIQKVERAWTPWNAKFYNMNKYFSNRK